MTKAERLANVALRTCPVRVRLTEKGFRLHVFPAKRGRIDGLLVGTSQGFFLLVRPEGRVRAGCFHPDFWEIA